MTYTIRKVIDTSSGNPLWKLHYIHKPERNLQLGKIRADRRHQRNPNKQCPVCAWTQLHSRGLKQVEEKQGEFNFRVSEQAQVHQVRLSNKKISSYCNCIPDLQKHSKTRRLSTRLPSKFQPCRSFEDSFHQIPHPFAQLHCHTKMHQEASIFEFEKRTGCERASRVGSLNIVGAADESLEMNALPLLPSYAILRSSLNPPSSNARKLFPTSFQWLRGCLHYGP